MIRSVTKNWFSIMLTFVLALILIYIFSILGYLFFQDDFWVLYDPRGCGNNTTGLVLVSVYINICVLKTVESA